MKPDKEDIDELERRLAESWRTTKEIKENYDDLSEQEIREKLSDLQVDIVLRSGTIGEMMNE